jgi:DNA-binding NtrC family response regulator
LFDVIIADYRRPGINGIEFFKQTSKLNQSSLKILITAYMNKVVVTEAKNAGVHDLIEKPFNPETIEKSLSRLLGYSSQKQSNTIQ